MTQILLSYRTATTACVAQTQSTTSTFEGGVLDLLVAPRRLLQSWHARATYRRDLARLLAAGPHLVRDLGLDEADAREEVRKPFWRA